MSYQVFARKYRPQTFDDVLGQDHVVQTLKNAIAQERLAHAYLFVGPRGTGKTSTARILAKALNCPGGPKVDFDPDDPVCVEIAEGRSLDVLEIDGASNNGVEQVRELRDNVKFAPTSGKFRIYYIDEVHMLTGQAFNALLKTLEEPPAHVKFIFATTEAHKILPTIISRCQRFDLRRIPDPIISGHLLHIAGEEGVDLDPLAAHAIAKGAEGGMRDAQSMLDQLVAFCGNKITEAEVLDIFGFTAHETIASLAGAVLGRDPVRALDLLHQQSDAGKDLSKLMVDLIGHFRTLLVHQVAPGHSSDAPAPEIVETVNAQAQLVPTERLLALIDGFAEAAGAMKWNPNKKLHFEIGLLKAIHTVGEATLSDVINTLAKAAGDGAEPPGGEAPRRAAAPTVAAATAAPRPVAEPSGRPQDARGAMREGGTAGSPARPAPTAADAPAGAGPVSDGAALWLRCQEEMAAALTGPWVQAGIFRELRGRVMAVGFHPEDRLKREQLDRPQTRKKVTDVLNRLAGRDDLEIKFEIAADVERPAEVQPEEDEEDGVEAAEPAPVTGAPRGSAEAGGGAGAEPAADSVPPDNPAFYQDPLIAAALEIFEARIKPTP